MGHTDEGSINRVIVALEDAWNRHDAHALASLFAEESDFTDVTGARADGREGVEEHYTPVFETTFRESRLMIEDVRIRFVRPDIAAVDAKWEMTGATDPAGNPRPPRKGLMSLIMVREPHGWEIQVMHDMDMPISSPRTEADTHAGMGHQWLH
ncbi:MAG: SgcJ/EcaC family oxidoreductase [Desulfomonile tiedjei]|nr:SgcJ/EcaC family oxidoreductase [Desulfomonile tiedjei]